MIDEHGLRWIATDGIFELGYWIVAAHAISPEQAISLLGYDPAAASPMSWQEGYIREADIEDAQSQAIRFISSREWTYLVAQYGSMIIDSVDAVRALSINGYSISTERTANGDLRLAVANSGEVLCSTVDPDFHKRYGSQPDLLVPEFKQHGLLLPDGQSPIQAGIYLDDTDIRLISAVEQHFSLSLPENLVKSREVSTLILVEDY